MQGDVLADVSVPGLAEDPLMVMVAAHPCSMRRGAKLAERVAVLPVEEGQKIARDAWSSYVNFMLLPDLLADGKDCKADFRRITSTLSENLAIQKRVVSLSVNGVLLLQQRLIKSLTRLDVPMEDLAQQMSPIFTEAELQRDWVEAAVESRGDGDSRSEFDVIGEAVSGFHQWLDDNDKARRNQLSQTRYHASLRREARSEAQRRYYLNRVIH